MKEFDIPAVFAELRGAVRDAVMPPSPAGLRARAEHQQRVRRASAAALVAAAVVAVVLGATAVTRPDAAPGPLPADPVTPSSTPTPLPTAQPPAPRPSLAVPPWPGTTIDAPIARVNWSDVTLTVPPREGCPSGALRFRQGKSPGWPRMFLSIGAIAYGDVTGDGSADAVLEGGCLFSEEGDHVIGALLVISRGGDGTLRTVGGWVGPAEWGVYRSVWVEDGRIVTEQQWSVPGYEYAPGSAAAYEWNGASFDLVQSGLTSLFGTDPQANGSPIDLGPDTGYVARALNCPGGTIQLGAFDPVEPAQVPHRGVIYNFEQPTSNPPHIADLAGDGHRYVIVLILCHEATVSRDEAHVEQTGVRGQGVLVLDRTDTGFRAVDVVTDPGKFLGDWRIEEGKLTATSSRVNTGSSEEITWTWNGQYFQR